MVLSPKRHRFGHKYPSRCNDLANRKMIKLSHLMFIFSLIAICEVPSAANAQTDLCQNAPVGAVPTVPALVADWVAIMCTPVGQVLVPNLTKRVTVWRIRRDAKELVVFAREGDNRQITSAASAYDIRFTSLRAVELLGHGQRNAMIMLNKALGEPENLAIYRIVELDAVNNVAGTTQSLIFYVSHGTPKEMIVCLNDCNSNLLVDIATIKY